MTQQAGGPRSAATRLAAAAATRVAHAATGALRISTSSGAKVQGCRVRDTVFNGGQRGIEGHLWLPFLAPALGPGQTTSSSFQCILLGCPTLTTSSSTADSSADARGVGEVGRAAAAAAAKETEVLVAE